VVSELRCVWDYAGTPMLASSCTWASEVLTIYAPLQEDIPADTAVEVLVTTIFATDDHNHWFYGTSSYEYVFDFELDYEGNGADYYNRVYFNVWPEEIPDISVEVMHWTPDEMNSMKITFRSGLIESLPDTDNFGRVVIELPTGDYFDTDLGLGIADNEEVPCNLAPDNVNLAVLSGSTLKCYITVPTDNEPVKVTITGLDSITADTDNLGIELPWFRNPPMPTIADDL